MTTHTTKEAGIRSAIAGMLLVFTFVILKELAHAPWYFAGALAGAAGAVFLARKTAHHFHGGHTHAGDSPLDVVATVVLFIANIFHPAVDGFSVFETFAQRGTLIGGLFLAGVVLHEVFRQGALIAVFRDMGIRWHWVIATALIGIASGIGMGLLGSHTLHDREALIDVVTVFAYTFIIAEFYSGGHGSSKRKLTPLVIAGLVIGFLLTHFIKAH